MQEEQDLGVEIVHGCFIHMEAIRYKAPFLEGLCERTYKAINAFLGQS